jgi:hypothetical protein
MELEFRYGSVITSHLRSPLVSVSLIAYSPHQDPSTETADMRSDARARVRGVEEDDHAESSTWHSEGKRDVSAGT